VKEDHSSHEELQNDVELMCRWLESLRIRIDRNRVSEYRTTFRTIAEHVKSGTLDALAGSIDFAKQADNFHDVSELIFIHQQLGGCDSPVFKRALAQAIKGPSPLTTERPQTSDARNKAFELAMTAQFHAAGLTPEFIEPDDAVITLAGAKCRVECKRIQTEHSLAENIEKASSQLKHRLNQETPTGMRGLIAIDISKTVNIDGALYFSVTSADQLNRKINEYLREFLKRNERILTKDLDTRIFGVVLYLRTPAVIEHGAGLLTNFRRTYCVPSSSNDMINKILFGALQIALIQGENKVFE
jgi:hypothetical protein